MENYLSGLAKRSGVLPNIVDAKKVVKAPPIVSLTDHIFHHLRAGIPEWGSKPFIVDTETGMVIQFKTLEQYSLQVASALSRRGFRKGDVLYHVTSELAQSFVIMLAVWRLGGVVRGATPNLDTEEYVRQIRESGSLMILVDAESASIVRESIVILGWPVNMFSVGQTKVSGTTSYTELLKDTAYTKITDINPDEDVVIVSNTPGVMGIPVGISHTHSIAIQFLNATLNILPESSLVHSLPVSSLVTFTYCIYAACSGITILHAPKNIPKHTYLYTIQHQEFHDVIKYLLYKKSIDDSKVDEDF